MKDQEIGYVSKYFGQISVAAIEITAGKLNVGDTIKVKGHTTDLTEKVQSMQIEHETVENAKKGDSIGIKVTDNVRRKDKVFKIVWLNRIKERSDII